MAAPTNYFVDPVAGTDDAAGGRGASTGDPWASIQWALDHITRDATNGDQINVKSDQAVGVTTTTDDTLGAALDLSTYGVPVEAAPLIFRGYTSAANDGGIGGIDGAASFACISTATDVFFVDLHIHNSGAADITTLTGGGGVIQCELDTTTASTLVMTSGGMSLRNHIHTFGVYGIDSSAINHLIGNYISDAAATAAINAGSTAIITNNIISVAGATDGIRLTNDWVQVKNNSILSAGGTGQGIIRTSNRRQQVILNNLVEGFSGGGGVGIDLGTLSENVAAFGCNAVFNCATKYSIGGADFIANLGDNDELTGSPFAKAGADTFANRFAYFEPTTNASSGGTVRGGSYPVGCRIDKGAVQHADPAGGGGGVRNPLGGPI